MHELNSLIEKFWFNRINRKELEHLEMILKELSGQAPDSYFDENESVPENENWPEDSEAKKKKMLHLIHSRIHMEADGQRILPTWPKRRLVAGLYWAAGAAACILLFFLSYPAIRNFRNKKLATQNIVKKQGLHFFMKIVDNNSDTVANVLLPDGSMSYVYPHSQISYRASFGGNKRDINLSGIARFNVVKDPLKPFTVFSRGVATTALGTYFKVTGKQKGLEIILYEGKLKIHPIHDSSAAKNAYLIGGQKLFVDNHFGYKKTLIADVPHIQEQQAVLPVRQESRAKDTFQLDYHNTPLSVVFQNMGVKYHKIFSYNNKAALDSLPFTGRFNKEDSLDALLKIICGMNNLQYEIHKQKVTIRIK